VALRVTDDGDATHVAETLAIIKPSVVEVDRFDRSWAEIELISPSGGSERIHLTGPTVVHVFFGEKEGVTGDSDGDGLDDVPTELVELSLTGSSSQGPVVLSLSPDIPSSGEMEEQENLERGLLDVAPFVESGFVDSFFDVFFELKVGEQVLHTRNPKRMSTVITHKPPAPGNVYENREEIELYDAAGNPTGIYLGAGRHEPNPSTCPGPLAGDANGDGTVDGADYTIWADNYGATLGAG